MITISKPLVLFIATLILSVANPVLAESLILRNTEGVEINAEIISATDIELRIKRVKDGRVFLLKIDSLDEESRKIVQSWRKKQDKLPTQKLEFTLGNTRKNYSVSLLVPKGEYNTVTHGNDSIRISFNTGRIQVWVVESSEKPKDTLEILEQAREESLGNMTPANRAKAEPLRKIVPMTLGNFSGFRTENNGSFYGRFVNGEFMIEISLTSKEGSPITEEEVPLIIPTIEIKK